VEIEQTGIFNRSCSTRHPTCTAQGTAAWSWASTQSQAVLVRLARWPPPTAKTRRMQRRRMELVAAWAAGRRYAGHQARQAQVRGWLGQAGSAAAPAQQEAAAAAAPGPGCLSPRGGLSSPVRVRAEPRACFFEAVGTCCWIPIAGVTDSTGSKLLEACTHHTSTYTAQELLKLKG